MCDPIPGADLRALRLSDPWARRRGEGLDKAYAAVPGAPNRQLTQSTRRRTETALACPTSLEGSDERQAGRRLRLRRGALPGERRADVRACLQLPLVPVARAGRTGPERIARDRGRVSGPLADRIDIKLEVPAPREAELVAPVPGE